MAKADVLERVRNDLAIGHTHTAIRRLRTLVAASPGDLELQRMLATVYRQTGNVTEAGRWAFLTDDLRPEELAAFERANPDPWLRLRMISWPGTPDDLTDPDARRRLAELTEQAEAAGPPARWTGPVRRPRRRAITVPCLFVVVVLSGAGVLAAIGLVRALRWIIG